MAIDLTTDVDGYFERMVRDALHAHRMDTTEAAERYVSGLLVDYARGDTVDAFDRPLTFQLQDALAATGAERFRRLQRIGDAVLYLLGFFDRSVTRRGADRAYVMSVGSSAYGHASAMMRWGGDAGLDVLRELSAKFEGFVRALRQVASRIIRRSDDTASVLLAYERWHEGAASEVANVFARLGVCPVAGEGGVH
ncbi:MAG: hypothetical protein AAF928_16665 [Myxococcota bacterium]